MYRLCACVRYAWVQVHLCYHTCGGQRLTLWSWFLMCLLLCVLHVSWPSSFWPMLSSPPPIIATGMLRLQMQATTASCSHLGSGVKFGSSGLHSKCFYPLRHVASTPTPTSLNTSQPSAPSQQAVFWFFIWFCVKEKESYERPRKRGENTVIFTKRKLTSSSS